MKIESRQIQLNQIFDRFAGHAVASPPPVEMDRTEWSQEDNNLRAKIASSKQGELFQKLFAGQFEEYESQSEADLALCNILALWTNKDTKQMDRIFRQSKLFRPKWDERHGQYTYGEKTIQKTIGGGESVNQGKTLSTEKKGPRFNLLTDINLAQLPPMQWIIKGILPNRGLGVLFGPSGSGKSFLALDLSQSVASGLAWFGHKVKPCNVIYVALEGQGGIVSRVKAYRCNHGKTAQNIRYLIQPFNLLTEQDVQDIEKAIKAVDGAGLVIIDTLNRAAPGTDENSSKDMGKIIAAVSMLQELVGGFVLLVHHTGKNLKMGLRGHSSLFAALDVAIEVKRDGTLTWTIAKSKDGKDGESFPFRLEVVPIGIDEDGDEISSCVIQQAEATGRKHSKPLTDAQSLALKAYREVAEKDGQIDDGVDKEAWRQKFYSQYPVDSQETKKKAFQRARKDLVDSGILSESGDIYSLHSQEPKSFAQ